MMMNNYFQDKTITSISFISPQPPRGFGGSFDSLAVNADNTNSNSEPTKSHHQKYNLLPSRIFIQSFGENNNNNINTKNNNTGNRNSLFACGGRFISAEGFLNLLRRSKSGEVFVFSGTCRLTTDKDDSISVVDDDEFATTSSPSENLFSKFISSMSNAVEHSRPSSAASTNTFFNATQNIVQRQQQEVIPQDAFLWFSSNFDTDSGSGENNNNNNNNGRWVSGKEIAKAFQDGKEDRSSGGGGGGCLFLNCDYACFAAQHQYFCGNSFEKLSNTMASVITSSVAGSKKELDFANSKTKSVLGLFEAQSSKMMMKNRNDDQDDLFRSLHAIPLVQNSDFDRSQLPLQIVPLSLGRITVMRRDSSDEQIKEIVHDIFIERLMKHASSSLKLPEFHQYIIDQKRNEAVSSSASSSSSFLFRHGAVIWSNSMYLTRLDPEIEQHQQFILELFTSASWQQFMGVMKNMENLEDAKNYIKNRPEKMFNEKGIGSFAVVVPVEKQVSKNRVLFDRRNNNDDGNKTIPHHDDGTSFSSCNNKNCNSDENFVTVVEHKIVGIAGLILRPEMEGDFDLGFGLLPQFQGHGYAGKASDLVLMFAKKALGLNRVRAVTSEKNVPSLTLLEKRLGFRKMFNGETNCFSWGVPNYVLEREL